MTQIIPYSSIHHAVFKQLNLEWLDKYGLTESHDLEVLDGPMGTIINRGGVIVLAENNGEIVGSGALIPGEKDGVYELAKMAVTSGMQGKGISKLIMNALLEAAKQKGAKRITLFSNHQLQTALSLYEKYGFRHVKVEASPFMTADVKMELNLHP